MEGTNTITFEAMDVREMITIILEENAKGNILTRVVWDDDERLDYELYFTSNNDK